MVLDRRHGERARHGHSTMASTVEVDCALQGCRTGSREGKVRRRSPAALLVADGPRLSAIGRTFAECQWMLANVYVTPANHEWVVRVPRSERKFVSVTVFPSTTPAGNTATGPTATPAVNEACDPKRSADPR